MSAPSIHAQQLLHLAVDDDRVEALFAAKVLVDDRFGDARFRGDLLDRCGLEPTFGEEGAPHLDELLTTRRTGHARAASLLGLVAHSW